MTVGEPKRITAIITRSISSNGKKRQHTKTRARTSVSREPVDMAVSCSIQRHFYLMLIWADSLSNKYENRRGSQFGADVRKYEYWLRSSRSEHRHEANSTGIQTVKRKKYQTIIITSLLSTERPQSSSILPTKIPTVLPTHIATLS